MLILESKRDYEYITIVYYTCIYMIYIIYINRGFFFIRFLRMFVNIQWNPDSSMYKDAMQFQSLI